MNILNLLFVSLFIISVFAEVKLNEIRTFGGDWIELVNTNSEDEVDINSFILVSHKKAEAIMSSNNCTTIIPPSGRILLLRKHHNTMDHDFGDCYFDLAIPKDGCSVELYNGTTLIDSTEVQGGLKGSWGRYPDSVGEFRALSSPTEGYTNDFYCATNDELKLNEITTDGVVEFFNPNLDCTIQVLGHAVNIESSKGNVKFTSSFKTVYNVHEVNPLVLDPLTFVTVNLLQSDDLSRHDELHDEFNLKGDYDAQLFNENGDIIDKVFLHNDCYELEFKDIVTWGRYPDGEGNELKGGKFPSLNGKNTVGACSAHFESQPHEEGDNHHVYQINIVTGTNPNGDTFANVLEDIYQYTADDSVVVNAAVTIDEDFPSNSVGAEWRETVSSFTPLPIDDSIQRHSQNFLVQSEILPNAVIRQRGANARLQAIKSFSVKMNQDKFLGSRKILLAKGYTDYTRVRSKLTYRMIEENAHAFKGLLAPRTLNANVTVNGENYGLYTILEDTDEDFMVRNGLDKHGDIYKGRVGTFFDARNPWVATEDYFSLQTFDKDRPAEDILASEEKLLRMLDALATEDGNDDMFFSEYMNPENVAAWIAFNIATWNYDVGSRNFLLYTPSNETAFYVLPWDYDLAYNHGDGDKFLRRNNVTSGVIHKLTTTSNIARRFMRQPSHVHMVDEKVRLYTSLFANEGLAMYEELRAELAGWMTLSKVDQLHLTEANEEFDDGNVRNALANADLAWDSSMDIPTPVVADGPIEICGGKRLVFPFKPSFLFYDDELYHQRSKNIKYSLEITAENGNVVFSQELGNSDEDEDPEEFGVIYKMPNDGEGRSFVSIDLTSNLWGDILGTYGNSYFFRIFATDCSTTHMSRSQLYDERTWVCGKFVGGSGVVSIYPPGYNGNRISTFSCGESSNQHYNTPVDELADDMTTLEGLINCPIVEQENDDNNGEDDGGEDEGGVTTIAVTTTSTMETTISASTPSPTEPQIITHFPKYDITEIYTATTKEYATIDNIPTLVWGVDCNTDDMFQMPDGWRLAEDDDQFRNELLPNANFGSWVLIANSGLPYVALDPSAATASTDDWLKTGIDSNGNMGFGVLYCAARVIIEREI